MLRLFITIWLQGRARCAASGVLWEWSQFISGKSCLFTFDFFVSFHNWLLLIKTETIVCSGLQNPRGVGGGVGAEESNPNPKDTGDQGQTWTRCCLSPSRLWTTNNDTVGSQTLTSCLIRNVQIWSFPTFNCRGCYDQSLKSIGQASSQ